MRTIKTHNAYCAHEIANIVANTGSFTAPLGLPHYRYFPTKRAVGKLKKKGLIKLNGKNDIHYHFVAGDNLQMWVDSGKPSINKFKIED